MASCSLHLSGHEEPLPSGGPVELKPQNFQFVNLGTEKGTVWYCNLLQSTPTASESYLESAVRTNQF